MGIRETLLELTKDDWEELFRIWRNPGWTTPAEFLLVQVVLDSMAAQAGQLLQLKGQLIEGSAMVGVA